MLIGAICFAGDVLAQSSKTYVRKQAQPQYFVPAKDLDYREKLPEFAHYNYKNTYDNTVRHVKAIDSYDQEDAFADEEEGEDPIDDLQEAAVNAQIARTQPKVNKAINDYLENDGVGKEPVYKQKYYDYINDLKVLSKTGKAPKNETLERDLLKMSSDRVWEVGG